MGGQFMKGRQAAFEEAIQEAPGSGRGRRLRLCAAGGLGEEVGFFIPELCELPKSVALVTTLSLVT